jgi:hypothetical protein
LNALKNLCLWGCSNLEELPSSIGRLPRIYLNKCSKFQEQVSHQCRFITIQMLYMSWCSNWI